MKTREPGPNLQRIEPGDPALTRALKRLCAACGAPLRVIGHRGYRGRYQVIDYYEAPNEVVAAARAEVAATEAKRAKARVRGQERERRAAEKRLSTRWPGMPPVVARAIAEHAYERNSGRVGRSTTADDPDYLAARAWLRHNWSAAYHADLARMGDDATPMMNPVVDEYFEVKTIANSGADDLLFTWESLEDTVEAAWDEAIDRNGE